MNLLAALVLVGALAVGWVLQLLGLAGTWLIVVAVLLYAWMYPSDSRLAIGNETIVALVILAVLGEVIEFVAGAAGVAKAGGSRTSAVLALVGSVAGGIVGIMVGLPIPVIGSLVAAIVFAGAGAMIGAVAGESWKGRDWDASVTVGKAAFVGRMLGTLAKVIVASIMVVVALAALVLD